MDELSEFERRMVESKPITLREYARYILSLPSSVKKLDEFSVYKRVIGSVTETLTKMGTGAKNYAGVIDETAFDTVTKNIEKAVGVAFVECVTDGIGMDNRESKFLNVRENWGFRLMDFWTDFAKLTEDEFMKMFRFDKKTYMKLYNRKEGRDVIDKLHRTIFSSITRCNLFRDYMQSGVVPFNCGTSATIEEVFTLCLWIIMPLTKGSRYEYGSRGKLVDKYHSLHDFIKFAKESFYERNYNGVQNLNYSLGDRIDFLQRYGHYVSLSEVNEDRPVGLCLDESITGCIRLSGDDKVIRVVARQRLDYKRFPYMNEILFREPSAKGTHYENTTTRGIHPSVFKILGPWVKRDRDTLIANGMVTVMDRVQQLFTPEIVSACGRIRGYSSASNIIIDTITGMIDTETIVMENGTESDVIKWLTRRLQKEKYLEIGKTLFDLIPEFMMNAVYSKQSEYVDENVKPNTYSRKIFYNLITKGDHLVNYLIDDTMPYSLVHTQDKSNEPTQLVCLLLWTKSESRRMVEQRVFVKRYARHIRLDDINSPIQLRFDLPEIGYFSLRGYTDVYLVNNATYKLLDKLLVTGTGVFDLKSIHSLLQYASLMEK